MFNTLIDVLMVLLGFGTIIFVHELGHFVAARWAGIRVLAFAIGFGPAIVSYRKGMGFRKGSTEPEYLATLDRENALARLPNRGDLATASTRTLAISPTEYRLNALPFGGYVKMLGQEDANPMAVSDAADSYQRCVPWKRLIVISAGVVMNIILAAMLFVIVFSIGRNVDPPIIGFVEPGRAAALAKPQAPWSHLGPGLRAGDIIERIENERPLSFDDLRLEAAMASPKASLTMQVKRDGVSEPILFDVHPLENRLTAMQDIGATPAFGNVVAIDLPDGPRKGDVLTHVSGRPAVSAHDLDHVVHNSNGYSLRATFRDVTGASKEYAVQPTPELMLGLVGDNKTLHTVAHFAGLVGVMSVQNHDKSLDDHARAQGLEPGDIFARVGSIEFPSIHQGILEVRKHKGKTLPIVVLRPSPAKDGTFVEFSNPVAKVKSDGRIGMAVSETADTLALIAACIPQVGDDLGQRIDCSAAALPLTPGTIIVAVDSIPVRTLRDVAKVVREQVTNKSASTVTLTIHRPANGLPSTQADLKANTPTESIPWTLTQQELQAIKDLGWDSNFPLGIFKPATETLRADNAWHALRMGIHETKRTMLQTYLTFARLVQGSIKVEHLKGPIGIAHLGTLIADRGVIWLLFFLALISVNLAVINFLPLPIVDGGQFLFILYEWIRGRPVPLSIQNAVTIAGLVMIGCMFLLVTYNDIRNLLGV